MELSWNRFVEISNAAKPSNFTPPDWDEVKNKVASELDVQNDTKLHESLLPLREKYFKYIKTKKKMHSSERSDADTSTVLKSENLREIPHEPPKNRKTKSMDQLGVKQLRRRTDQLWEKVEEFADNNDESPLRILALLLTRCNDRSASDFGEQVWSEDGEVREEKISINAAIAILVNCSLGRQTYSNLWKILKEQGHNILPPWIDLREKQTKISPEPTPLPQPHTGVHFSFLNLMQLTAGRIMESIPKRQLPTTAVMNVKYGFDGSGSHAIYRQLNNEKTNNIIMTMFCPLNITESGDLMWEQKSPNSPLTPRPLALQMGKESAESLRSLAIFNEDQTKLKTEGCKAIVGDVEVPLKVNVVSHMMDMKAAHLYLGLTGAYCDLCDVSRPLS